MIKKISIIVLCLALSAAFCCGCSSAQSTATPTETLETQTLEPSETASEDLSKEGTVGDELEDVGEVSLTAEEKAFFGSYDGNAYTNNWLGFTMTMTENYSFYSVPELFELYNDVLTNMDALRSTGKTTGVALGSDEDGNCITINATYIKSGAAYSDATSYVTEIKSNIKDNASDYTEKNGADKKVKGITYKTFTCDYKVGDDEFYEKHYLTVKDGFLADICFSADTSDALNELASAFENSK